MINQSRSQRRRKSTRQLAYEAIEKLEKIEEFAFMGQLLRPYLDLSTPRENSNDDAADFVIATAKRFPKEITDDFIFDTMLLRQILDEFGPGASDLSRMVIPSYYKDWGYESFPLESLTVETRQEYELAFIYFARKADAPPELDRYIWVLHELFHHLLWHGQTGFEKRFGPILKDRLHAMRMSTLGSRGDARTKATRFITLFEDVWGVNAKNNWPTELFIDTLCIWTAGPSYARAFSEAHDAFTDPFIVEPSHPPAELRADTLIRAMKTLGWASHTPELEQLVKDWQAVRPQADEFNRYQSLKDDQLIATCIKAACALAHRIDLPRLAPKDLPALEKAVGQGDPLSGRELLIAAQLYSGRLGTELEAWEKAMIDSLIAP